MQKVGYTGEEVGRTLSVVLPDILRFDRSKPAVYANGAHPDRMTSSMILAYVLGLTPPQHDHRP